jgi:hypothetical protein
MLPGIIDSNFLVEVKSVESALKLAEKMMDPRGLGAWALQNT